MKQLFRIYFIAIKLLVIGHGVLRAQPANGRIFLQTDKRIYALGEDIWFCAQRFSWYVQDGRVHALYLSLNEPYKKQVVTYGRYVFDGYISAGRMIIPDSVADGRYTLVAYTEAFLKDRHEVIWSQPIYVRSLRKAAKRMDVWEDSTQRAVDSLHQTVFLYTATSGLAPGCLVAYRLYKGSSLLTEGKGTTDKSGRFTITSNIKECAGHVCELLVHAENGTVQKTIVVPVFRPVSIGGSDPSISILPDMSDTVIAVAHGIAAMKQNYIRIYQDTMLLYRGGFVPRNRTAILKMPRDSLPDGNIKIIVYDDSSRPIAEKHVVLLPRFLSLEIVPDALSYKRRSLCKVNIVCRNKGLGSRGVAIIDCALRARSADNSGDIENCFFKPQEDTVVFSNLRQDVLTGSTKKLNGKLSPRQQLILVGGRQQLAILRSDSVGRFTLPIDQLVSDEDELLTLSASGRSPGRVDIVEPDILMNEHLARCYFPAAADTSRVMDAFTGEELSAFYNILPTATVKAQYNAEDNSLFPDMCKVWVCACGHFMCNYCPPKRPPIKGRIYRYMGRDFEYTGCPERKENPFARQLKAYIAPRCFEGLTDSASKEQELYSTLFFKSVMIDGSSKVAFEFFTNDLKGEFLLTVKLMTDYGPVTAETAIIVE